MNIIKYKIWSKLLPGWITDLSLENLGDIKLDLNQLFETNTKYLVFCQFTGKQDINNKDIYEGDILKVRIYDSWDDDVFYYVNHKVCFSLIASGFRGFTSKMDIVSCKGIDVLSYWDKEIVGNMFESLELLDKIYE